ncbi:MAG: MMPL family transporter, partial [Bacteroidales bacterium]|nr:MMPL family transporter [Bacteroidales bacterium]
IGHYEPDVMRSTQLLAQKTMPGLESKYYAVLSKDLDSALTYNIAFEKKCRELAEKGLIKKYSNSAMLMLPRNVIEERIAMWENYWNPEKVEQTRKLLSRSGKAQGFKEGMFDPFMEMTQAGYEANSIIDAGIIPEGLLANLVECTDSTWLVFTSAQARPEDMLTVSNTLVKETEGVPSNAMIVVDPFFYTQNMVKLLNDDFNVVLGISSLFVLVVLLLSFRNLAIALIAFLPMSMSWYIVLGVMGLLGLEFNLINIVISTFIFGIGVDYSIFVMDGLLGKDNPKLLTYHKTAIFFSAVVLILSIASLMFAVHPAISSIGLSTLIGMASTIAITYTLEPFLFNIYKKWKDAGKK